MNQMLLFRLLQLACVLSFPATLQATPVGNADRTVTYLEVDVLPSFSDQDGHTFLYYVYRRLQWPKSFDGRGTVLVSFVVQSDGRVGEINVIQGLCPACDEQVISILKGMPCWTPGTIDGQAVNVLMYLPVHFKRDTPIILRQ